MSAGFSSLIVMWGLTLRPYVPPTLLADPAPAPSRLVRVEVVPASPAGWDANVLARPTYAAPLVGHVARGARLTVVGELATTDRVYCATGLYYALGPERWICSADTEPTTEPATTKSVLELVPDSPLPYRYVMVNVAEGEAVSMWGSIEQLEAHAYPERELNRGDTLAVEPQLHAFEGQSYYLTVDGKVVPVQGTTLMTRFSEWKGVELTAATHFPFGWVTPKKAPIFDAPSRTGKKVDELPLRTRVDVLEELFEGKTRWLRIGDGRFIKADHLNEVQKLARPEGTGSHLQWIDVDLGEQVVVAYRGAEAVYATLTSSGREPNHTPLGNYPVWGKSTAITMKSQDYDDSPYYVNRVPWVLFFQAHNALHAAYWHDRFGSTKSHGCANLSPMDAHYMFDWLEPALPPGWTSVRYWDLTQAPVVHVRNSRRTRPFFQERNVGPPDKDDEAKRLDAAVERRQVEAAIKASLPDQPVLLLEPAPAQTGPLLVPGAAAPLLPPAP